MKKLIGIKKEILEKSKLLLKDDPKTFSVRKIAKECNIGTGTLYNYYKCKEEIIIDLMYEYWHEFLDLLSKETFGKDNSENFKKLFELLSRYGKKFRVEMINVTDQEIIQKARKLHQESFESFVKIVKSIFHHYQLKRQSLLVSICLLFLLHQDMSLNF